MIYPSKGTIFQFKSFCTTQFSIITNSYHIIDLRDEQLSFILRIQQDTISTMIHYGDKEELFVFEMNDMIVIHDDTVFYSIKLHNRGFYFIIFCWVVLTLILMGRMDCLVCYFTSSGSCKTNSCSEFLRCGTLRCLS